MKRSPSPYLKALPAFVVLVIYSAIVGRSLWIQGSMHSRYRDLGQAAVEKSEFELARTYFDRVAQLNGKRDPGDDFSVTLAAFKSGDFIAGQSLLDRLAPADGLGYPKAHRLKAVQLVARLMSRTTGDSVATADGLDNLAVDQSMWELVRLHLTRSGGDAPVELAELWSAYYVAAGKPSDAIAQQMEAARIKPDRWLATAQFCDKFKDENQRKRACRQAEVYLTAKIKDNPFDHLSRIQLARALIYDKRFDDAAAKIFEGLELAGNDASSAVLELRQAASEVLLLQMDALSGNTEKDLLAKHQLVTKAIELDANNPLAYQRLLVMFATDPQSENRRKVYQVLEQQLTNGQSMAMTHFSLGFANWVDGNRDNAVWHTERALALEPKMTEVMNNYAWMLAHANSPDLERALTLIDAALEKNPDELRFRDTKGVVLMKLERWEEALTEFESILPRVEQRNRATIHGNLAEIYAALGRASLAERHRAEAVATTKQGN